MIPKLYWKASPWLASSVCCGSSATLLSQFAAEMFSNLHEEVLTTAARGHTVMARVQQLEDEVPSVEKACLSRTDHESFFFANGGGDWHPKLHLEQNLISHGDLPRFVMDSYEECRGPPQLFLLDKFDVAGSGACLKRYTDPSIFKIQTSSSSMVFQREKKARKVKKKGSQRRNGETPEVTLASHTKLHELFLEERVANSHPDPARVVKIKRRHLNGSPFELKSGRSYMEKFLETLSPDSKAVCQAEAEAEDVDVTAASPLTNFAQDKGGIGSSPEDCYVVMRHLNEESNAKDNIQTVKDSDTVTDSETDESPSSVHKMPIREELAIYAGGKTPSFDGAESDDMISEMDNYMDALTYMESEIDTDNECKTKNVGALKFVKQEPGSNKNEERHGIQAKLLNIQSFGSSSMSDDGNSSLYKGGSSISYSDSLSNLADNAQSDVDGPLRTGGCTEHSGIVTSAGALKFVKQEPDSNKNEEHHGVQAKLLNIQSFRSSSTSDDGNSSIYKGGSSISYSGSLSNLADNAQSDVDGPLGTGGCTEHSVIVTSAGALKFVKQEPDSNKNEERHGIQAKLLNIQSFGSSSMSDDGNSSIYKGGSSISYSDSLSNLADNAQSDVDGPLRTGGCTEHNVIVTSALGSEYPFPHLGVLSTQSHELLVSDDRNFEENHQISSGPLEEYKSSMFVPIDPVADPWASSLAGELARTSIEICQDDGSPTPEESAVMHLNQIKAGQVVEATSESRNISSAAYLDKEPSDTSYSAGSITPEHASDLHPNQTGKGRLEPDKAGFTSSNIHFQEMETTILDRVRTPDSRSFMTSQENPLLPSSGQDLNGTKLADNAFSSSPPQLGSLPTTKDTYVDQSPPVPPLPPMQWIMGKVQTRPHSPIQPHPPFLDIIIGDSEKVQLLPTGKSLQENSLPFESPSVAADMQQHQLAALDPSNRSFTTAEEVSCDKSQLINLPSEDLEQSSPESFTSMHTSSDSSPNKAGRSLNGSASEPERRPLDVPGQLERNLVTTDGRTSWPSTTLVLQSSYKLGKPNGNKLPLIDAAAATKSKLRKVVEQAQAEAKGEEKNSLLEQIRATSFKLKPTASLRPSMRPSMPAATRNLKVAAMLEKAAIRQVCVFSTLCPIT
ncbi:Protein SCAR2, partial [Linum grandiflorum]